MKNNGGRGRDSARPLACTLPAGARLLPEIVDFICSRSMSWKSEFQFTLLRRALRLKLEKLKTGSLKTLS